MVDKKTGFVKAPRGVLIEVDPDAPTGSGATAEVSTERAEAATPEPAPTEPAPPAPTLTEPAPTRAEPAEPIESAPDSAETPTASTPSPSELLADVDTPSGGERHDVDVAAPPEEIDEAPASPALAAATEEASATPEDAAFAPGDEAAAEEPAGDVPEGDEEELEQSAAVASPDEAKGADPRSEDGPSREKVAEAVARAIDDLACLASLRVQVAKVERTEDGLEVELEGPDGDRLAARGGRALLAMQHLLPRLLFHDLGGAFHCRLDCEGFQQAREEHFEDLARRAADKVRDGGRPWMLDPMAPDERRLVHLALAGDDSVETNSVGEGFLKRVRVSPA